MAFLILPKSAQALGSCITPCSPLENKFKINRGSFKLPLLQSFYFVISSSSSFTLGGRPAIKECEKPPRAEQAL